LLGLLLMLAQTAGAADEAGVEIRTAVGRLTDAVWLVDARVDYRLNRDILEALQAGIPLTFELRVQLDRQRSWLPDTEVVSVRQDYELSWQPLSRGYLVRNKKTGEQRAHTTLYAALNDLGRVKDVQLIDSNRLEPDERYEVSVRARLDQQQLPGLLQFLAFWDGDFTLDSEWYRWRLGS
jgi:hypothetical protein